MHAHCLGEEEPALLQGHQLPDTSYISKCRSINLRIDNGDLHLISPRFIFLLISL